ncbi:MAG: prepilin-type N-terminal cleavage/methylation domain-containing protein [Sedimentisphaerales bacterium]|nr:prepilin-type N-terminal cleavage/methylation domain-containing protein [Sedimentisphaerales bacterium]
MKKKHRYFRRGLTLLEMVIACTIFVIMTFGVSSVLSSNQRLWNAMYNRTYSDEATSAHLAKKMFDACIRKSSKKELKIDTNSKWVESYYYADETSTQIDRYVRFFYLEGALFVEHGLANPKESLNVHILCDNVTNCLFKQSGRSVHMLLTYQIGNQTQTIGTSAEMHND